MEPNTSHCAEQLSKAIWEFLRDCDENSLQVTEIQLNLFICGWPIDNDLRFKKLQFDNPVRN